MWSPSLFIGYASKKVSFGLKVIICESAGGQTCTKVIIESTGMRNYFDERKGSAWRWMKTSTAACLPTRRSEGNAPDQVR